MTVYIVYPFEVKTIGLWIKPASYFRTNFHFINYRAWKTF